MKKYLGGYAIIDLDSDTIYNDLLNLKGVDKTILLYDPNETKSYFIDTIVYDTDSIVITKGGKTITITDTNAVSSVGDIQPEEKHLYQYYLYLNGNDLKDVMFKFYSSENLTITMDNLLSVYENYIANNTDENLVQLSGFDSNNNTIMTCGYLGLSGDDIILYFYGAMVNNGVLISTDSDAIITSIDVNKLQLF